MKSTLLLFSPRILSAVAASALLGVTAFAQAPAAPGAAPTAPAEKPKPLQFTDETYVKSSLKSLYYLIQLANAAKTNVTDPNLARMRDTAAQDLTTALKGLSKIAEAHGLPVPTEIAGNEKVDLERLGKVKPDKYPKEWVEALFKEIKHLDHETEMASKTAQDDDLKTFIGNYTPTIHGVFTNADGAEKAMKAKK